MASSSSPSQRFKKICVFGGFYPGKDKVFADEAILLGAILAQHKIQLIYGGGNKGLMGAVAAGASAGGSSVLGIVPNFLKQTYGPTVGTELRVWSIHERISIMYHSADAFIALPGGLGTLEEIACVASWLSLTPNKKPIGLLNINGCFDGLLSFLDKAVENGFMFSEARVVITSAATAEDILKKHQQFRCYPRYIVPQTPVPRSGSGEKKRDVDCTLTLGR